jgi:hypothetical protein
LVRWLREQGKNAEAIETKFQEELPEEASAPPAGDSS